MLAADQSVLSLTFALSCRLVSGLSVSQYLSLKSEQAPSKYAEARMLTTATQLLDVS